MSIPARQNFTHRDRFELPNLTEWTRLAESIRNFDADVVVLVARKVPRLVEAFGLDFGENAICVSDQAIPFVRRELENARVAVVDDVWNIGTTMLHAKARVQQANPRTIRLFALAAKNADKAREAGVNLTLRQSLNDAEYQSFVQSVPDALKLVPKPYDVDFPLVPCHLRAPLQSWSECLAWLRSRFGENVHSTTDAGQLKHGFARASITVAKEANWTIKARLYFDFRNGRCNVVPIAIAPVLPLKNEHAAGSLPHSIFEALRAAIFARNEADAIDNDAIARINTFCDSLLFADTVVASLEGLCQRESARPFSLDDVALQFGPTAAKLCDEVLAADFRRASPSEIQKLVRARQTMELPSSIGIGSEENIIGDARRKLTEGGPYSAPAALQALLENLGRVVGAENPSSYALEEPFSKSQVKEDPYLRLRIGFTFEEIINVFRSGLGGAWIPSKQVELEVSALVDAFIDDGAMVPTFTVGDHSCARIYRKGEANPRWDRELRRLKFALDSLNKDDRTEILDAGRTRISKICAILAFAESETDGALVPGALERGTVGSLARSVVELEDAEITNLAQRFGYLK
jgi:hypothetical protein